MCALLSLGQREVPVHLFNRWKYPLVIPWLKKLMNKAI